MNRRSILLVAGWVLVIAVALLLRLPDLGSRPMHTDEAVHAVKAADMAENGRFDYDPTDYHGPTLHYSIAIRAMFAGKPMAELNEIELRQVAVFWGIAMLLIFALPWPGWPSATRLGAAALLAVSPAAVYYARYLIMEEMFVLFTGGFLLAGWSAWTTGRWKWVVLAGVFAGLMHATKETCVLAFGAIAISFLVLGWKQRKGNWPQGIGAVVVGVLVSALFLSGGFRHWDDVLESYTTYFRYLDRSEGAGHEQPFGYYFNLLTTTKDAIRWGEWPILLAALAGGLLLFLRRDWKNALGVTALTALLLFLFYSAIAYKTPWCVLSMHWVMALLGGSALAFGLSPERRWWIRLPVMAVLLLGALHFQNQNEFANGRFAADNRNPWVYGHTSTQAEKFLELVADAQACDPQVELLFVQREAGWPFPWYFREMGDRAQFPIDPPEEIGSGIVVVDGRHYETATTQLPDYKRSNFGLRPGVIMTTLVEPDLWDQILQLRADRKKEATP